MIPLKSSAIGGICLWCEAGLFTDVLSASELSAGHKGHDYQKELELEKVKQAKAKFVKVFFFF